MGIRLLKIKPNNPQQTGFILPILLITGVVIALMIAVVSSGTLTNNRIAKRGNLTVDAQMTADAGLDYAMNQMNSVENWSGTSSGCPPSGECTLMTDSLQNLKMTYQVTVADGADADHKTLTVTARAYSPISASTPSVTRKYAMDIVAVTSGTSSTSISSGVGGLILSNNAKITGGDVVVNGKITMSNNSQIGLSTNSVNVRVAHQSCPISPDSTYPIVCGAGNGEPINMTNSAKIYGDVRATNQTTGTNMFNPGLVACGPGDCDPVPLPTFDRTAFKNAVNSSGQTLTGSQASTCTGNEVNWPADVKITGDVSLSNNCTAKINGDAWITGKLELSNNAKLAVQNGVGTTMPDIVVDGSNGIVLSNNSQIVPNTSNTGVQLLTFWSAASCSPDCSTVTGVDLYNSQGNITINLSNSGSLQNSVLYAYWSKVSISNNGAIGAVAGQTVDLSNSAVINFSASIPGSDNLVRTWVKRGYMRIYN
jgi:Tfp pilus assembly protein PilX